MPIAKVLLDEGLNVYAVDAAPSLVEAFRHNFPQVPIACESVLDSLFFERTFDGVVAWGPLDEIRPNPFFQPPDARTGRPIDVSDVKGIAFAPQDKTSGRLAIGKFAVTK